MFQSEFATRIFDKLYKVNIPDQLTLDKAYLSKFGTHITGDKNVDNMLTTNFTTVMIPIAGILDYYERGIEIQIPSRDDMICMHKDIELYLTEWKEHIKYDINLSIGQNKDLLLSLEKLSKYIYNKAKPSEVIDNLFIHKKIGLINPLQKAIEVRKEVTKPNYEGISQLVKSKTKPQGRF